MMCDGAQFIKRNVCEGGNIARGARGTYGKFFIIPSQGQENIEPRNVS